MTYNAASRKDIRAAEKSQVIISTIDREVIAGLMSVKNGRHWISEQLANSFVFRDPFSPDPSVHAYNAGLRAAGIKLFNDLVLYAPDNLILMMKESHERAIIDAVRSAADRPTDGDSDAYPTDEYGRPIYPSNPAEGAQPTQ